MSDRPNAVMQFFTAAVRNPTMIKVGGALAELLCSMRCPGHSFAEPLVLQLKHRHLLTSDVLG